VKDKQSNTCKTFSRAGLGSYPCFSLMIILALSLWCPLLPYGYSYKASCARPC